MHRVGVGEATKLTWLGSSSSFADDADLARSIEELAHASPATLDYMRKLFAAEKGG